MYSKSIPVAVQDDHAVYFLDYTGPRGLVDAVAQLAARVVVLDHHKTAQEDFAGRQDVPANVQLHIDMKRCGASLARDYFKTMQGSEHSKLIAYIEDGDLWRWQLPDAKAFYAGLRARNLEYDANKNPSIFEQLLQLTSASLIAEGKEELHREERIIADVLATMEKVQLGGEHGRRYAWGCALAVALREHMPHVIEARSELGNRLAEASAAAGLQPIGAIAYADPALGDEALCKVSLRGTGDVDVSAMCKHFDGGGHRLAGSCIMPWSMFDSWLASL